MLAFSVCDTSCTFQGSDTLSVAVQGCLADLFDVSSQQVIGGMLRSPALYRNCYPIACVALVGNYALVSNKMLFPMWCFNTDWLAKSCFVGSAVGLFPCCKPYPRCCKLSVKAVEVFKGAKEGVGVWTWAEEQATTLRPELWPWPVSVRVMQDP